MKKNTLEIKTDEHGTMAGGQIILNGVKIEGVNHLSLDLTPSGPPYINIRMRMSDVIVEGPMIYVVQYPPPNKEEE